MVSPDRRRGAKGTGAARREEILETAKRVFVEDGFQAATMRKIAQRLGLTATALYFHFRDKDELLAEIADRTFGRMIETMRACTATEPVERIRELLRIYIEFGVANPDEYRLTFMTPWPQGELFDKLSHRSCDLGKLKGSKGAEAFAFLADEVGRAIAAGQIPPGDVEVIAETMWAALHGLVSLLITFSGKFPDQMQLEEKVIEMILRGCDVRF